MFLPKTGASTLSSRLPLSCAAVAFLFACIIPAPTVTAQSGGPSVIKKFWDIGCEFSSVVTRVRRSVPVVPEPDYDDPEELFQYLYPLADVKHEEVGNTESGRLLGAHSLSSWLEDLMELWHSECHNSRNKRSSPKTTASRRQKGQRRSGSSPNRRHKNSGRTNSTLGFSSRSEDGGDNEGEYYESNEDEDLSRINKPKPDKVDAPPTTPAPAEDIFFSQYGGDIEYFFPLLSFGIPFDGEITLLGFHGFRGLFPY